MKKTTIIAAAVAVASMLLFGGGCCRPESTRDFLKRQGYTQVEITGWRPFMADKNDTFSTGFRAKNANGQIVTGSVTEGILKGKTIRFD